MYEFLEGLVANYMTCPVKTVTRQVTMRELNLLFESNDFNAYPVEEHARVLGLVTKFDFLSCFAFRPGQMVPRYDELMNRTVADVMTPEFIYVNETTRLTRVLQLIVDHRIKSIPVIEADHRLGRNHFTRRYYASVGALHRQPKQRRSKSNITLS
ncbi:CBS domain containing membrane protein (plasmid) [Nitrobacter hamburgensis X14]|uniref:CBS domain containing membrane protein n=1 Tax=Nitrobacter hamburgensis (strain DSM 10229 / NCIMB 13809 / X14) TaxID=323097 RepID=Q1QFN3_NITHX|nr:CBS domain containing membrane protein [Nitrobacter hamburgensis X14]